MGALLPTSALLEVLNEISLVNLQQKMEKSMILDLTCSSNSSSASCCSVRWRIACQRHTVEARARFAATVVKLRTVRRV